MSLDDDLYAEPAAGQPAPDHVEQDQARNHFPDVFAFVEEYLVHVYARPVDRQRTGFRWCSRWHDHTEALARLEALWQAFEALRVTPGGGMSVWWINHADPTMAALTDSEGPFRGCSDTTHKLASPLPITGVPEPRSTDGLGL